MSISDTSVAATVGGVQLALKLERVVPLAVYLKIVQAPRPPAAVPSPQFASLLTDGNRVMNFVLLPVSVGRTSAGADAYPVSPRAQKSPVCVTVLVRG